jgi:NAD+ kinase
MDMRCDGMIASTPTGSTAYSLSAGGPILSPVMKAIVVSPLNPHILSIRPMVYPDNDKLTFRIYGLDAPARLQIDGINVHEIEDNDELTVTSAKKHVNFIKLSNRTFYKILRNKMHLGK